MGQWPDVKELFSNLLPAALNVIGNTALTAVLYGLEYLVEKNSPCPCDPEWNAIHSDLAFSVPTVVLLLISMMMVPRSRRMFKCGTCRPCPKCGRCSGCPECGKCKRFLKSETYIECCDCRKCTSCPKCDSQSQSNNGCCCCWNTFNQVCFVFNTLMQISIPSVIWVVILLLDGDYVACYFAPSVNRTHGHQTCKEFCSLETSSSLRERCFWSRKIGSIILVLSVFLLVLVKFIPRWTYCDCTEEGYYKFKYQQSLEKKKWNKMTEDLGKLMAETANDEANQLISKLKQRKSDQGEQSSNQGEPKSNQGDPNSNQGELNSNQANQGEPNSNQTRDTNADEAGPSESSA
ncbi:uncharacterized protein LOC132394594 [Hypanus sabinus]|uniref:uncharacterized protein LOC132394594 n=1 Tax=Hypanus sabinus TaxID=79690 RepID=UPI0028C3FA27|nr:uncharacterized protein LOC132394594 [Hypanus sabinus]XP_059826903.1 uncharacterized protein LOC132394594 [Hypanus sabinus]XP_059826904.1 uncharacterized protein LOC132394594 [Hypanus sabinus]